MKRALALFLTLVLMIGAVIPSTSAMKPADEKQQAVISTALAYYYRGHGVQYDSNPITDFPKYSGGPFRGGVLFSPEDATEHNFCFSVCSNFIQQIYYETFGWVLLDNWLNCTCSTMMDLAREDSLSPMVMYYYSPFKDRDTKNRSTAASKEQAVEDAKKILQTGDVLVVLNSAMSGHAMLYGGDLFDDGSDYVIHCWGGKYDITDGSNTIETKDRYPTGFGGSIRADNVDTYLYDSYGRNYSLPSGKFEFIILRPLNVLKDKPLTTNAQSRMKYERLSIDRTADVTRFKDVPAGEDFNVNIVMTNYSKNAYSIPVTQIVPEGTALKKAEGATVNGNTLSWNVELKPEEPKTITYTLTATGKRGDVIKLSGGNFGGIRDNVIEFTIGGKGLTSEQQNILANLENYKTELKKAGSGHNFVNYVYQNLLKLNVEMPKAKELNTAFYEKKLFDYVGSFQVARATVDSKYNTVSAMRIPHYYGGTKVYTEGSADRLLTFETLHLKAGDFVLYTTSGKTDGCILYLGNDKVAYMEGSALKTADAYKTLSQVLTYDYFYGFRPTLAYDDINTEAKYTALPFTDVQKGDWYYEYVSQLYNSGVVSGMTETTFVPAGQLTFGQALKLITCGLGYGEQTAVSGGNWASGYVKLAKEKGWLTEEVNANAKINRLQFCRIAAKAKNLTEQPAVNVFTDCSDPAVLALNKAGVITGVDRTTFAPEKILTRAQITKIIRCLQDV